MRTEEAGRGLCRPTSPSAQSCGLPCFPWSSCYSRLYLISASRQADLFTCPICLFNLLTVSWAHPLLSMALPLPSFETPSCFTCAVICHPLNSPEHPVLLFKVSTYNTNLPTPCSLQSHIMRETRVIDTPSTSSYLSGLASQHCPHPTIYIGSGNAELRRPWAVPQTAPLPELSLRPHVPGRSQKSLTPAEVPP